MDATGGKVKKGTKGRKGGGPKMKPVSRSVRDGLQFPVGRIGRYLKKERYAQCAESGAHVYLAIVLEYLTDEVLELVGNVARHNEKSRIIPRHGLVAVRNDGEHEGVLPNINPMFLPKRARKLRKSPSPPQMLPSP